MYIDISRNSCITLESLTYVVHTKFPALGQLYNWAHNLLIKVGFWVSYNGQFLSRLALDWLKWLTSLTEHPAINAWLLS